MIPWLAWLACSSGAARPQLETMSLDVDGHPVTAEVADDPGERHKGLMYRKALDEDSGMLFVYPGEAPRSFWMENTQIPLSIAYIRADGTIAAIKPLVPFDRTSVPSGAPVLYALEMTRGWFEAHQVQTGDPVKGLPPPSQK